MRRLCCVIGYTVATALVILYPNWRQLWVKKDLACLTWTFEPNRRCLEAAMLALRVIRRAPPTKTLRR